MAKRIVVAVFVLLSLCSVASMKLVAREKPAVVGGGGLPTPPLPPIGSSVK
jgi:hypothetical protein